MADKTVKVLSIRQHLMLGVISNYLSQIITIGIGIVLTPVVLRYLGTTNYGLWLLIGSLVSYGSLLEFGIMGATVKYVAEFAARGEREQLQRLVATSFWLYLGLALLAMVLTCIIALIAPQMFVISEEQQITATNLVLLTGITFSLGLPMLTGLAVMRGLQRFDLISILTVTGTLLSATTTVVALVIGGGVIGMATSTVVVTLLMYIPTIWNLRRLAPDLRFAWQAVDREMIRKLCTYSAPLFVFELAGRLDTRTDELVISAFLPVRFVTPYGLARRLSEAPQLLTSQFLKVVLPLASALHAEDDQVRLRMLYFIGTRLTLALFIPIGAILIVLAGPILTLWVGEVYASYDSLVTILVVASLIGMSEWTATSILQGMARHQILAISAVVTALLNLILSIVLVRFYGLIGVALGTLIPYAVECLFFVTPYTMRVIGVSVRDVLGAIVLPAIGPAIPMVLILVALRITFAPMSLVAVGCIAIVTILIYTVGYLLLNYWTIERKIFLDLTKSMMYSVGAKFRHLTN